MDIAQGGTNEAGINWRDDTRMAPRLFELTPGPHTMGIAVFIPLDDPLNRIAHPLSEFWPLLDCMP